MQHKKSFPSSALWTQLIQ